MHDYFVIGMVEEGQQQFLHQRSRYVTPPTGLIVINPGEAHTGEAADAAGFRYRSFYPESDLLTQVASQVRDRNHQTPFFFTPVISDAALFAQFRALHITLEKRTSTLEHESDYLWALARLIVSHAAVRPKSLRRERLSVQRLRQYIDEHYADDIKLADLAALEHWTSFYLLRVFRAEMGVPPHAYLESVRIRQAQRLLKAGQPVAATAYETGFSSQSHFTTTFKRFIGVTPARFAKQVNFLKDTADQPAYDETNQAGALRDDIRHQNRSDPA